MTVRVENIEITMRELAALADAVQAQVPAAVDAAAEVIREAAAAMAPGPEIGRTPAIPTATGAEARVGPEKDRWYYKFFETGTQAGTRTSRRGMFTFTVGGRFVRVRSINHPGLVARPFLRPAGDTAGERARAAFVTTLDRVTG
jgi:HK97 gp10 family phage protein